MVTKQSSITSKEMMAEKLGVLSSVNKEDKTLSADDTTTTKPHHCQEASPCIVNGKEAE